jgi:hypothetical protein
MFRQPRISSNAYSSSLISIGKADCRCTAPAGGIRFEGSYGIARA